MKIRYVFILLGMLSSSVAAAHVGVGIWLPGVSIGINLPVYPELVAVPGYPVYYAPRLEANFFFYDGMYWVYQDDNWYQSSWYNGPWWLVGPEVVPVFILRIPVRYYRMPPAYFLGWRSDAPPRWGDHWGRDWEHRRSGWDRWTRGAAPAPAPLPAYQRQYSGDRYPRQVERQQELQKQHYRYKPRDPAVQQHYHEQEIQRAPVQQVRPQQEMQMAPARQDIQRPAQRPQYGPVTPRQQSPQSVGEDIQKPISPQPGRPEVQDRRPPPQLDQRGPQEPGSRGREERPPGQGRGRDRND